MSDRRRQIELLIATRFDYTFEPETFTGKVVRRGATAGKGSPSHWQTCSSCEGGSRRDRFGKLVACDVCNATGRLRVDDYTGDAVITDEGGDVQLGELIARDTHHVGCPDCQELDTAEKRGRLGQGRGVVRREACRRCNGTGWAAVPGSWLSEPADPDRTTGDPLDAMLNAIERRNTVGSYHELDQALAGISRHVNKPLLFVALTVNAAQALRLLDDLYTLRTHDPDDVTMFERALVDLALAYIDTRMPDPIRVPPDVVKNARLLVEHRTRAKGRGGAPLKVRDAEIRKHARAGKAPQWIAGEYGLSVSSVYAIVNGKGVAA